MRSSLDALRSLKKYVAAGLGPEWEVRLAWEEGTFRRPFARVGFAGQERSTGPAHTVDVARPFNVLCHPPEADAADVALLTAADIGHRLVRLFEAGVSWTEPSDPFDPASPPVAVVGRARRVPLWNWDGVPVTSTSTTRAPNDYLRVVDLGVNDVADPIDELRRAVGCDVRLAWRRPGEARPDAPTLRELRVTAGPTP